MASVQLWPEHQNSNVVIPVTQSTNSTNTNESNVDENNNYDSQQLVQDNNHQADSKMMAIDIQPMSRLKKMGWYWGSISPEFASKLLLDEQDGSFLVRDSSSECYIFSMTFKLEGQIHHARIEHNKGKSTELINHIYSIKFI